MGPAHHTEDGTMTDLPTTSPSPSPILRACLPGGGAALAFALLLAIVPLV